MYHKTCVTYKMIEKCAVYNTNYGKILNIKAKQTSISAVKNTYS